MSSRKRAGTVVPVANGDLPPPGVGDFTIPDDTLVIVRAEGEFGYVVNGASTVPMQAWPTVLRRMAVLIERQLVDGA